MFAIPIALAALIHFLSPVARPFFIFWAIGSLVILVSGVVHATFGWLFRLHVEEVAVFVGPSLLQVPVRRTLWRLNCIPLFSGYVKFLGQDPADPQPVPPPPGLLRYTDLHPLSRILIVLSAPLALTALGAALLGPAEFARWAAQLPPEVYESLRHPHAHLAAILRRFIESFSTPEGLRPGVAILCALNGLINLTPLPIFCGGQAVQELLAWLFPRAPLQKRYEAIAMATLFAIMAIFLVTLSALLRALFA